MTEQRWLRIIPVALIIYPVSLKGEAAGIFVFGCVLRQIPGGFLASRWSTRKLIGLCLPAWGLFTVGCGSSQTFRHFELMRCLLGVGVLVCVALAFSLPKAAPETRPASPV